MAYILFVGFGAETYGHYRNLLKLELSEKAPLESVMTKLDTGTNIRDLTDKIIPPENVTTQLGPKTVNLNDRKRPYVEIAIKPDEEELLELIKVPLKGLEIKVLKMNCPLS